MAGDTPIGRYNAALAGLSNDRQRAFVFGVLEGKDQTQAYIDAGFKSTGDAARANASRLIANDNVAQAVAAGREVLQIKAGVTQEWVLKKLVDNVERAMQAEPVLSVDGTPMGVYNYAGSVANGALTLLGKHLGMFVERQDVTSKGEQVNRMDVFIHRPKGTDASEG